MCRFVTTTVYTSRETMYNYHVYGLRCVCINDGYRREQFSEYKIHVYADHLSFPDKWSFLLSRQGNRKEKIKEEL